jgi:HK97 family phage prohead protease/HK97 family phage major capsid protein
METMSKELQNKSIPGRLELKETREDGKMHIKAYALAFGNVDSYGDVILPTACDKFLASEEANRMRLCYQHDRSEVIGVITDKGVDSYGMWIEADILPTTTGKDVQVLLDAEAINEFSIGYYAEKYHYEKRDGYQYELRILEEITVREVSPVTIAANPKAVLIDKKEEGENKDNEQPSNTDNHMDEMKKQLETIEQKAAAAEKKAADLAAQLENKETELKTAQDNINNLDASVKSQQTAIEALQAQMKKEKVQSFAEAVKATLEENKDRIEKMFAEKSGGASVRMEVKATAAGVGAAAYGTAVDTQVGAAPHVARAFLAAFAEEVVNADKAAWLDGTFTNAADYVDELTAAADSDATANEVIRQFGKIATRLLLSSELNDWMTEIANWAQTEAVEFINDKVDSEVWNGAGADTSAATKKKIYGLKSQATAFSKVATYENANVGDVILDAVAQAKKNGYVANVAIVSFATEAELKAVKDANGNYIYNQLTGMFGPVRVLPSAAIGANEILVADSRCAKILRRPTIEIEITRDADLDGWKVNVRRAAQTKVKTAHKKGLIYVADKAAAITAIAKA